MDLFNELSLNQQIYKCGGSEKVHLLLFSHYLSLPFPHSSSPCFSANIYMQDLKWWPAMIGPLSGALIASSFGCHSHALSSPSSILRPPPPPSPSPQANRVCVIVRLGVFVIVYSRFANFFFLFFSWLPLHLVVTLRATSGTVSSITFEEVIPSLFILAASPSSFFSYCLLISTQ